MYNTYSNSSTHVHESHNQDFDRMIHKAVGVEFSINYDEQNEDFPNTEAQKFYNLLHASQKSLWPGCTNHTESSIIVRILTIKLEETCPNDLSIKCWLF